MLYILNYKNRFQIEEQLKEFDFENNTWVLSDLRSKLEIQNRIFKSQGFTLDEYILRASDLWRTLLRKSEPEFEVISLDYALLLVKNFLGQIKSTEEAFLGLSEKNWLDQLSRWSQVVFDQQLKKQVDSYFQENQELKKSLGREFILAGLLSDFFMHQKKIISGWIPAFLQSRMKFNEVWSRPLWVDLRGELTQGEAEIFQVLSRNQDVYIFRPDSDFETNYFNIAKPYEYLISKSNKVKDLPAVKKNSAQLKVIQFSGPLAEVKWSVGQVRQWLDEGIPIEEIAIVAPDIEDYWPCLRNYLNIEGIPVQKSTVSRLSSFPEINQWLSTLRSSLNPLDYFSHEKTFFGETPKPVSRFEDFRSLLFELYETVDLSRLPFVYDYIKSQSVWPERLGRDEFIVRCLKLWPLKNPHFTEPLKMAIEKFLRETQATELANPKDWLHFFESLISQIEVVIDKKNEDGILVTSLMSAWSQQLKKVIFLGMADENLKSQARIGLSPIDSLTLSRDLGILIESTEKKSREYEIRWWLKATTADIFILEPNTDWSGQLLNHSPIFLNYQKFQPQEMSAVLTRWDQIQQQSLIKNLDSEDQWKRLQEDLSEKEFTPIKFKVEKLSPSAVENYLKCHFIFLAGRGFKLLDKSDIDVDIDRQKNGQFLHGLAEKLLITAIDFKLEDQQIINIIEELRNNILTIRSDDPTWIPRRNKFLKWSQFFLETEKKWKNEFPENTILKLEAPWEVEFKVQNEVFYFRGRIDRIDGHVKNKEWLVLDYKSTTTRLSGVNSWLKNNQLQLLFYLWAIEKKAIPDIEGKVLGAFYYSLKTLERNKGLRIGLETSILPPIKRKNSVLDPLIFNELLKQFELEISKNLTDISAGLFQPKPKDEKDCPSCPWKKVCRAPHLNM